MNILSQVVAKQERCVLPQRFCFATYLREKENISCSGIRRTEQNCPLPFVEDLAAAVGGVPNYDSKTEGQILSTTLLYLINYKFCCWHKVVSLINKTRSRHGRARLLGHSKKKSIIKDLRIKNCLIVNSFIKFCKKNDKNKNQN